MKTLCKSVIIRAFLALLLVIPAVGAAGGAVVGYIEDYSGTEGQYAIRRGNAELQVGVWAELLVGDKVRVKEAGQTLTVRYTDESRETFGPEAITSDPLAPRGEESSVLRNLFASLAGVIHDFREQRVETVAAITRGVEPLALDPLNASGANLLVAGRRTLYLAWRDGIPPFSVTVTRNDPYSEVVQASGLSGRSWHSEAIDLQPGTYQVTIADADTSGTFVLQVVDETSGPAVATGCVAAASDEVLNTLTHAYCLARLDNGRWAFEASQLLAPVASGGYKPAKLLLEGLRAGEYRYWTVVEQPQTDH